MFMLGKADKWETTFVLLLLILVTNLSQYYVLLFLTFISTLVLLNICVQGLNSNFFRVLLD